MTAIVLPPRITKQLRAAGITSRADLVARIDELAPIGIAPRDVAMIRRRLGLARPAAQPTTAAASAPIQVSELAQPPVTTNSLTPDPTADLPELLTTTEAAAFLRVGRRAVADWCLDGAIRAFRLGADWRIPRAELRRLLGVGST